MSTSQENTLTPVEMAALEGSSFRAVYPPTERISTIVVDNFPALGKLAAMRFLEWVQGHPGGVVSLPTGKTPEHFITWVRRLLETWDEPQTKAQLDAARVDPGKRPDMRSLHFVQIDEFYPISPDQRNSFHYYVDKFYVRGFGLEPANAMLIDCSEIGLPAGETLDSVWPNDEVDLSLRHRQGNSARQRLQKDVLVRIDEWCRDYEERVRGLGGIGFFLGGIGPDGHVGFNVRGADHFSTTRLTELNFETQAAAAQDLGGIETARKCKVITIGLGTITFNSDCTAVIIAAGSAKARIVADAVQNDRSVLYPATALHALPNARFYVTAGAAGLLTERRIVLAGAAGRSSDEDVERVLIDLAVAGRKRLVDLTPDDVNQDRVTAATLAGRPEDLAALSGTVRQDIIDRIEKGARTLEDTRFLHTEPHHDDVLLGYLPYIVRHLRHASNVNHFVTMTSGFTAVTNDFLERQLERLTFFLDTPGFRKLLEQGYFHPANIEARNRDVWQYLDGVAADRPAMQDEGTARRLLCNLIEVHEEYDLDRMKDRITELRHYFNTQYPGKKDPPHIQRLKGMRREWEAECLWGYFGGKCADVAHLRLGFYTGDIFTEEPSVDRDVMPILREMERTRPDVVTVALDPEASGPDTHYKVLQATTEALKRYAAKSGRSDIRIWGYRNVWFRFHPSEANIFVPISLNMFSIMRSGFMNTFLSQKNASFPSYEHDGPFCELAQKIQVEQYQALKTCLGRKWFHENPSAMIRATRGFVFLHDMGLAELLERSRKLKYAAENK